MASALADGSEAKVISPIRSRTASEEEKIQNLKAAFEFERDFGGSNESLSSKKNILVDEDRFIETFLRCLICQELFNSNTRPPKLLPCHHSLCISCVLQIFITEAEYRASLTPYISDLPNTVTIICPTCKGTFVSTEDGIRQLPTDHRVFQILDFIGHTERLIITFCQNHKSHPLNFFCEPCCCLVCRDCTIVDHKETNGHIVLDIDGALENYKPIIEKAMSEMTSESNALKEKKAKVETAIESLDNENTKVAQEIRETFKKLRKILDDREQEIISMAQNQFGNEKEKLNDKIEDIDKRRNVLEDKVQSMKQVKEGGNVEQVYKLSQSVQNYKSDPVIQVKGVDDGETTKISFENKDESYLSQKLQSYGDIICQVEKTYVENHTGSSNTGSTNTGSTDSSYSLYSGSRYGSRYSSDTGNRYSSSDSRYTGSSYTGSYTGGSRYTTGSSGRYGYYR